MPSTDVAMPTATAHAFHLGSSGAGQATTPRKKTLTVEIR
jgi:hypothetical protein